MDKYQMRFVKSGSQVVGLGSRNSIDGVMVSGIISITLWNTKHKPKIRVKSWGNTKGFVKTNDHLDFNLIK